VKNVAAFLLLTVCSGCLFSGPRHPGPPEFAPLPYVTVTTDLGSFTIELDSQHAPETVRFFLDNLSAYKGSTICRLQNPQFMIFGCSSEDNRQRPPQPIAANGPPPSDEIDGVALALNEITLDDPAVVHTRWQREIYPRYMTLKEDAREMPKGLAAWIHDFEENGEAATKSIRGITELEYLQGLGYEYRSGGSAVPFDQRVVTTTGKFPGETDARFMIGLSRQPQFDGRVTVFGHIVEGWDTIQRIQRLKLDKTRRPIEPFMLGNVIQGN
jgi:cyclophilin family peptidyl-prolyl cis-trans isomerase